VFLFLRFATVATLVVPLLAQQPDVGQIIQRSVAANQVDFDAAPQFNYKETDREGKGSKTYQVTMISGTPYNRLIAVNGKPLSKPQQQQEEKKQQQETSKRRSESASERQRRIAKFEKDRKRDHAMMEQLTKAFDFTYLGERQVRGFHVWILRAKPRRGYQPPNLETQVLPGMQGQLWIDQKTYQWVKVTAEVVRPVSIVGFLAKVEPGTQFEMEMSPVEASIWQISRFSMRSRAKILGMINRRSEENSSYFDYRRANDSGK
jgi:hypothetical protein